MKDIKKNLIIFSILFIVITAGVLLFSFWLEKEQKKKNPFLQDLKAGDVITFGRYEQDNRLKNGPEDLKPPLSYSKEGSPTYNRRSHGHP